LVSRRAWPVADIRLSAQPYRVLSCLLRRGGV